MGLYKRTFGPTKGWKVCYIITHNIILGQSEDWILCVPPVTRTCKVWRNALSRFCQSIGHRFNCSVGTLLTLWLSLQIHGRCLGRSQGQSSSRGVCVWRWTLSCWHSGNRFICRSSFVSIFIWYNVYFVVVIVFHFCLKSVFVIVIGILRICYVSHKIWLNFLISI